MVFSEIDLELIPRDGCVVVTGLWDLRFLYKQITIVNCTYNYDASMQNCICCERQINVLSIYL